MLKIAVVIGGLFLLAVPGMAGETQNALPPAPQLEPGQKWLFSFTNLAKADAVKEKMDLVARAGKLGYNGILISDVKFDKLFLMGADFAENCAKFREACTAAKMKLIVGVAPFGYSDMFLAQDPNLAEGMPVRKAPFIVKNGKLIPCGDTASIANGSFEELKNGKPLNWEVDGWGKYSSLDDKVKYEGKAALGQNCSERGKDGVCRLWQKIKVRPWNYYHISAMVKTEDWTGRDMRIFAYVPDGEGRALNWQALDLKKTQDWTREDATFCSQDFNEVLVYLGSWGAKEGKIWWSDVKIEPGGFVNLIRRESCPLTITSEDGAATCEEGKDFGKAADPKLGHDPNPGYFTRWHEQPVVAVPEGSRLKEGQKVLASYNFSTAAGTKPTQMTMCIAEPKVYELVEGQVKWLKEHMHPDMYLISHDEIRHGGWDDSCVKSGKTPAQLLADSLRKCAEIIKRTDAGKPVLAWNDMFDPFHNASDKTKIYYLVKGNAPWAGSWEGLTPDVCIANWMSNKVESQKFFAERGNQQLLAGYYDNDPDGAKIVDWLKRTNSLKGIAGVIYTTWNNDYTKIEPFINAVKKYEASGGQ